MPLEMPMVYEGDLPYIFVDYARADTDAVLPIIAALVDEGYRVWYYGGVEAALDYPESNADHIHSCACVIMFISHASIASHLCRQELHYAIDLGKPVLPIYLEPAELPRGLQLRMGLIQGLSWYVYDSDESLNRRLFEVPMLDSCLTDGGRRARLWVDAPILRTWLKSDGNIDTSETYAKYMFYGYPSAGLRSDT